MIRLDSVSYAYPHTGKPALTNLSLSIGKGQCVMVTGPSGAGKTTLCLASAGILAHEYGGKKEGAVTINGRDVKSYKDLSDIATNLGIVFDDPEAQLIFTTVEEELLSALERRGLQVDEIEDRLRVIMEMTKLTTLKDRAPHTLSGGQKQRLVLAVTLALGTGILILDEPTSELDEHGTSGILEILKGLKAEGRTILIVEHKFIRMREIVDILVVMEDGRIRASGAPDEIIKDPGLQKTVVPDFSGIRERTRSSGETVIPEPLIRVKGLSHTYGEDIHALSDIGLTISSGEFIAIVGENGSGKTTLIKHFNGLLKATGGAVSVKGKDASVTTITELCP